MIDKVFKSVKFFSLFQINILYHINYAMQVTEIYSYYFVFKRI